MSKKKFSFKVFLLDFISKQKTKINLKNLKKILYAIFCFFLIGSITYYRDNIIKIIFDPKPRIIVNVIKVEPLNQNSSGRLENFNLLFNTFSGKALIAIVKISDMNLNKLYGNAYIPDKLINPESYMNYTISLKNIEDEVAKNITVDLISKNDIHVLEHDPKIKIINCGITPMAKSCHLEISTLSHNEEIFFCTLNDEFEKKQFNVKVDGEKERVSSNFISFQVCPYPSPFIMEFDRKKLKFPPINNESVPKVYYWKKDNTWEEIKVKQRT
jgi:hypothetical protein